MGFVPAPPSRPTLFHLYSKPIASNPNPAPSRPSSQIATVDKYQGAQNDYILLSLVRSRAVGHLRDVRRLVVAMSRARLGLYVFGRKELFANCYELKNTFRLLMARPTKLALVKVGLGRWVWTWECGGAGGGEWGHGRNGSWRIHPRAGLRTPPAWIPNRRVCLAPPVPMCFPAVIIMNVPVTPPTPPAGRVVRRVQPAGG